MRIQLECQMLKYIYKQSLMIEKQPTQVGVIKLQPVPKTHLFMKKITRIQAIDRQIRKKWIQIKRQNEKQHLQNIQEKPNSSSEHQHNHQNNILNLSPTKNQSQIINYQSSLKREIILNNHRRQQEIFYGKKDKVKQHSNKKKDNIIILDTSKQFLNNNQSRKRIKSESKCMNVTNQKTPPLSSIERLTKRQSPQKLEERFSSSLSKVDKKSIKVPFMLEKIRDNKRRQKDVMTCQSQKQLIQLSSKNKYHFKEWASQRKDLFQKLKGSKAYYIMKSPTKLSEAQDVYIF